MKTFEDVIGLWGSLSELAADLGVPYGVAKQWRMRNSIPANRWAALVEAAQKRNFQDVSTDALAEIARARASEAA